MDTLILSRKQIEGLLTYEVALARVESVFREWGKGNVVMPAKITLDLSRSGYDSWANSMPAYIVADNAAGVKWIGGYADNAGHGLPFIMGAIIVGDPRTGRVLAFMDGSHITNLRTGASAAVAAKYLARADAQSIAIVGAGTQGHTCLTAMSRFYPHGSARVADVSEERRRAFCRTMGPATGMRVSEAATVEEAVGDADIIVLVTTAKSPIVKNAWIRPGALVLGMGSFQQVEDDFAVAADRIFVDSWDQASHRGEIKGLVESGKIGKSSIAGELGEIVAGRKQGRASPRERILMVPVGLGAHDISIAHAVYVAALEKGIGTTVELYEGTGL